ncbi:DUF4148 domain-containing protein [Variovorax dokdonensis]|uniref:DUF4148 domain-containing protein n=1 Tax=Variovorax dokdonensis TaxID=344883 RepID=A0ABT7N5F3_9BURK|nr:DUF4148 domain-containing protein [Variovorax dokdonensis]MDM0043171.1 DUF4148 domain-containing protein [Variovorax dokdonensis]
MTVRNRLTLIVALGSAACTFAGSALAFQGEEYPMAPPAFESTRTRAEVRAEALNPLPVNEGSTGVMTVQSDTTREQVRRQAVMSTRDGSAWYGEMGPTTN